MKKRVFALMLVLLLTVSLAAPAFAAEGKAPCVQDLAGLLTGSEMEALTLRLRAIAEKFSVEVAVVTVDTCGGENREAYAKETYLKNGYGFGQDQDGVLLLIEMDKANRGWAIYGRGLGADAVDDYDIQAIGERITPYLKDGDYGEAFALFADECEAEIDVAINGEPFRPVTTFLICLVIGLVIALIVTGIFRGQLKSVRSQRAAANYVRKGSMAVTESRDFFLYRTVHRRERPKSSSGGSGGGGVRQSSGSGSF